MARVILKGSERAALPGAQVVGPADPGERLEVSVIVRRHANEALQSRVSKLTHGDRSAGNLSRQDFAKLHSAEAADLAAVRAFATSNGLMIVGEHPDRRTVILSGTVEQFNSAFSFDLKQY